MARRWSFTDRRHSLITVERVKEKEREEETRREQAEKRAGSVTDTTERNSRNHCDDLASTPTETQRPQRELKQEHSLSPPALVYNQHRR